MVRYRELSPRSYEHPADQAATAALHAIPLFDRLVKRFGAIGAESRLRQGLVGDAVRIGPDQLAEVWAAHERLAHRFDTEPVPLFVARHPLVNAGTVGVRDPVVVLTSTAIADRAPDEIEVVLAHELGHVLSDHATYATALAMLELVVGGALSGAPLAGLPVRGLYYVLLEWHRAAELTSDRLAALAVDDPMVVCRVIMRGAGGDLPGLQVDAFLRQAAGYAGETDLFARKARASGDLRRRHPSAVRRAHELVSWVQSGDFDRIRSGQYVRRGAEPPLSGELRQAVSHYQERFAEMLQRTVGGVDKVADQMTQWLGRMGHHAAPGGEAEDHAGTGGPGRDDRYDTDASPSDHRRDRVPRPGEASR